MIYAFYGPYEELEFLEKDDVLLCVEKPSRSSLYKLAICDGLIATDEPPGWIQRFCLDFAIPIYTKDFVPVRSRTFETYPVQAIAFRALATRLFRTHLAKNDDYGPGNLLALGGNGILVRIFDKVARLLNLFGFNIQYRFLGFLQKTTPKNEAIADTYMDLATYAILGYLSEANFLGR